MENLSWNIIYWIVHASELINWIELFQSELPKLEGEHKLFIDVLMFSLNTTFSHTKRQPSRFYVLVYGSMYLFI